MSKLPVQEIKKLIALELKSEKYQYAYLWISPAKLSSSCIPLKFVITYGLESASQSKLCFKGNHHLLKLFSCSRARECLKTIQVGSNVIDRMFKHFKG